MLQLQKLVRTGVRLALRLTTAKATASGTVASETYKQHMLMVQCATVSDSCNHCRYSVRSPYQPLPLRPHIRCDPRGHWLMSHDSHGCSVEVYTSSSSGSTAGAIVCFNSCLDATQVYPRPSGCCCWLLAPHASWLLTAPGMAWPGPPLLSAAPL